MRSSGWSLQCAGVRRSTPQYSLTTTPCVSLVPVHEQQQAAVTERVAAKAVGADAARCRVRLATCVGPAQAWMWRARPWADRPHGGQRRRRWAYTAFLQPRKSEQVTLNDRSRLLSVIGFAHFQHYAHHESNPGAQNPPRTDERLGFAHTRPIASHRSASQRIASQRIASQRRPGRRTERFPRDTCRTTGPPPDSAHSKCAHLWHMTCGQGRRRATLLKAILAPLKISRYKRPLSSAAFTRGATDAEPPRGSTLCGRWARDGPRHRAPGADLRRPVLDLCPRPVRVAPPAPDAAVGSIGRGPMWRARVPAARAWAEEANSGAYARRVDRIVAGVRKTCGYSRGTEGNLWCCSGPIGH